jgi:hypothetical protein
MERRPFSTAGGDNEQARERRNQHFRFGPWVFDVRRAQAIVAESPRETRTLPVQPWAKFYGLDTPDGTSFSLFRPSSNFDAEYALTTDLAEPLIVATLRSRGNEEFPLLIDGTHRLYRGFHGGLSELPALRAEC